jgi:hypothetical protein
MELRWSEEMARDVHGALGVRVLESHAAGGRDSEASGVALPARPPGKYYRY